MSGTKRGGGKKSQRRIRSVCAPRSFSSMFVLIVADRCSPPLEAGAPPPLLPPLLLELICWTAHGRGKNSPRGSGRGRGKSSLTNLQRAQQRGDKPLSLRDQPRRFTHRVGRGIGRDRFLFVGGVVCCRGPVTGTKFLKR